MTPGMRMMRIILVYLFLAACVVDGAAQIRLPASGVLAGPLDDERSSMGDDIYNYPFGSGSGRVNVHGWVSVEFSPPVGRTSRFRMRWHAVGESPFFVFSSGHFLNIQGEQTLNSSIQMSQGDLNLDTGGVTNLEVHAIFQNTLIQKSARNSRLPLLSDLSSFTALFVDFPPLELPVELPFSERPATSQTARFLVDSNQRITGFEFHGVSLLAITVLPNLGLMPPFAFGREGLTISLGADGCLPEKIPADQCLSEENLPDGLILPDNSFLNPVLNLVTEELREAGEIGNPPALPGEAIAGAAAASLNGRLYVTGGSDGERPNNLLSAFDPERNEWTHLQQMPRARWRHCAVAAAGKIYVGGGLGSASAVPLNDVAVFDPGSGSWSSVAPLPAASAGAACTALDSRIYRFGGATATAPASDTAWVFDTGSGQWQLLAPLPVPLAGSAAAVVGREIWIINGTTDGQTATNRVFVFSPDSGTWREGPPTPRAVYGASAAWHEGRIYVAGGRTAPGGALDVSNVLYHSQTMQLLSGSTWYNGLEPPLPASGMAGAVLDNKWYLVGGDAASNAMPAPTGVVQVFVAAAGWRASDSYPVFAAQTVRNAAGLGVGPAELAPGTLASIIGANLSPRRLNAPAVRREGVYLTTDLPEELDGIRVSVDGLPAGIVAVAPERIDFQVPFGLATGRTVLLRVSRGGVEAPPALVTLEPTAPGIFTYTFGEVRAFDILNEGAAIATNANGTLNYPSQPARPGETITLRGTGLGDVTSNPAPLQRGPRQPAVVAIPPEVLIDGRPAAVQEALLVPGEAGLYDVRVTIPLDTRTGVRVLVQLRAGDILSNRAVLSIE